MSKIPIKRIERNKKHPSTKEKILAGFGVGAGLLGGAGAAMRPAVLPQTSIQSTQNNRAGNFVKEKLIDIFGVPTALAADGSYTNDYTTLSEMVAANPNGGLPSGGSGTTSYGASFTTDNAHVNQGGYNVIAGPPTVLASFNVNPPDQVTVPNPNATSAANLITDPNAATDFVNSQVNQNLSDISSAGQNQFLNPNLITPIFSPGNPGNLNFTPPPPSNLNGITQLPMDSGPSKVFAPIGDPAVNSFVNSLNSVPSQGLVIPNAVPTENQLDSLNAGYSVNVAMPNGTQGMVEKNSNGTFTYNNQTFSSAQDLIAANTITGNEANGFNELPLTIPGDGSITGQVYAINQNQQVQVNNAGVVTLSNGQTYQVVSGEGGVLVNNQGQRGYLDASNNFVPDYTQNSSAPVGIVNGYTIYGENGGLVDSQNRQYIITSNGLALAPDESLSPTLGFVTGGEVNASTGVPGDKALNANEPATFNSWPESQINNGLKLSDVSSINAAAANGNLQAMTPDQIASNINANAAGSGLSAYVTTDSAGEPQVRVMTANGGIVYFVDSSQMQTNNLVLPTPAGAGFENIGLNQVNNSNNNSAFVNNLNQPSLVFSNIIPASSVSADQLNSLQTGYSQMVTLPDSSQGTITKTDTGFNFLGTDGTVKEFSSVNEVLAANNLTQPVNVSAPGTITAGNFTPFGLPADSEVPINPSINKPDGFLPGFTVNQPVLVATNSSGTEIYNNNGQIQDANGIPYVLNANNEFVPESTVVSVNEFVAPVQFVAANEDPKVGQVQTNPDGTVWVNVGNDTWARQQTPVQTAAVQPFVSSSETFAPTSGNNDESGTNNGFFESSFSPTNGSFDESGGFVPNASGFSLADGIGGSNSSGGYLSGTQEFFNEE